ncbi:hybrid sensor histidine kinase/response regulator [Terriglobus tenax]|uniref:hybrid sensor histidine kinase/response regulator n=1 Tax=Terriglobus tenax TaxID=1111115 RepID=UPI0021E0B8CB|nr:hybrid sensor histidine kinase/response regulator [Terriglobus tenax]
MNSPQTNITPPVEARRRLRVLVVEDYEPDALLLRRHLNRAGYDLEMRRIETREQMREALHDGAWDLVIADYTLPSFGARDALAMLQASGMDLPFIIVSGTISEESAVSAMRAGAHDYVLKGNLERLLPAIERELADADARREKLRTSAELKALESRFSATFNQAAVGMAHISLDGRWILANQRLRDMVGQTAEGLEATGFYDLLLPAAERDEDREIVLEDLLSRKVPSLRVEKRLRHRDGHAVDVQLTISVLQPDPSETESLSLVIEDISARKADARERADLVKRLINSERLASAGRMANTLAHEINNPLEALTNVLYLLQTHQDLPEDLRDLVSMGARELDRVGHITRTTLSFYRGNTSAGHALNKLIGEVLQIFASRAEGSQVQIITDLHPSTSGATFALSLRQVFANLIGNAIEAMSGTGGTLTIRSRETRTCAIVTIADTGPGIAQAHISQIFEPFFTTKGERGTGLGLWVTRGIVEESGGTLSLRTSTDAKHRGTTMRIALPLKS